MATVTLDTNLVEDEQLTQAAHGAGFEIVHTTVTDRELAGSGVAAVAGRRAQVFETIVLDESPIGVSVLGSQSDPTCFETLLKVISDGAFPGTGRRDNLTAGQRRQLRDAMIFCAHVREKRQIFVTNDKKGFIDEGRREFLEKQFNTKILAPEEFFRLCKSIRGGAAMKALGWIAIVVAALIAGAFGTMIGKGTSQALLGDQRPVSKKEVGSTGFLLKIADEINKSLPMMVDKGTQLRNVGASDRKIIYDYVLVEHRAQEVNASQLLVEIRPRIQNYACSNPQMKTFWENGVSASYQYYGNDNVYLGVITVAPADCGYR